MHDGGHRAQLTDALLFLQDTVHPPSKNNLKPVRGVGMRWRSVEAALVLAVSSSQQVVGITVMLNYPALKPHEPSTSSKSYLRLHRAARAGDTTIDEYR